MNILVISPRRPSSSAMPGSNRTFELFRRLEKKYRLILTFPIYEKGPDLDKDYLSEVFDVVSAKCVNRVGTRWSRFIHNITLSPHFLTKFRYPTVYKELQTHISDLIHEHKIDLIYVDQISMVQYLPKQHSARIVVDLCDCISALFMQRAQSEISLKKKLALRIESFVISKIERQIISKSDRSILISKEDVAALRLTEQQSKTSVIELGIDCEYFSRKANKSAIPTVVFVGGMDYLPNNDGAIFLARDVFPILLEKVPDARLLIVGKNPSSELLKFHDNKQIIVTGTVLDVRPFLEEASVFVSPLRFGVGMKTKILIAMSMKVPIVASSVSITGILLEDRKHFILADSREGITDAICEVLANQKLADRLQQASFEAVSTYYNSSVAAQKLGRIFDELFDRS